MVESPEMIQHDDAALSRVLSPSDESNRSLLSDELQFLHQSQHPMDSRGGPGARAPPRGAGVGAPEGAGEQWTSPITPSLPQPSPVQPMAEAMVNHVMATLADKYALDVEEHKHASWLLSRGLIRAHDARAVCNTLGIPERKPGEILTPTMLQLAPG